MQEEGDREVIEREKPLAVRALAAMTKMALSIAAGLLCGHIMVEMIEKIG